jgi:hypothetical protein
VSVDYATAEAEEWLKNKRGKGLKWIMKRAGSQETDDGPFDRWEEWQPRFGEYRAPARNAT